MVKNIVIFGFRYTGKSTIGKLIADKLNFRLIDVDLEIKNRTGKTIDALTNYGKDWYDFRKIEYDICNELINQKDLVISCGGGFAANDIISDLDRKTFGELEIGLLLESYQSFRVLLDISEENLIHRIKLEGKRTRTSIFGKNSDKIEDIITEDLELYRMRKPLYLKAEHDLNIITNNTIKPKYYSKKIIQHFQNLKEIKRSVIIGKPIEHSMSANLHNACYRGLDIDNKFNFTKFKIDDSSPEKMKNHIISQKFTGISITSPYKEAALKIVDETDDFAKKIGAINTILNKNEKLYGYNTDHIGVLKPLENLLGNDLKNKRVAVFGSGGAAKSAVIGLIKNVKSVSIFNRTNEKNKDFAEKNNIKNLSLTNFNPSEFDIIINATTVGLNSDESILLENQILSSHIIFDMVYSPYETKLLKLAKSSGAKIIHGTEMLIYQAIEQFKIYTKINPDIRIMRKVVEKRFCFHATPDIYKICTVVYGKNKYELIKRLKLAQEISDFIEIRSDYIENLKKEDILDIALELKINSIFTCRMKKFGGNFSGSVQENQEIINYAESLDAFRFFDIDLENSNNFSDFILKNHDKIILSWHEFNQVPDEAILIKILEKMGEFNPAVCKLAFKTSETKKEKDMIQRLLAEAKSNQINLIIAPMGSPEIRKFSENLSSWTNFYALSEDLKTAPGQIVIV